MNNKIIKLILSLTLSIGVVFFLLQSISIHDVISILSRVRLDALGLALLLFILMVVLRAFRFELFFRGEISFRQLTSIVCLHNCFNEFLPFRSGELVYILLMRKAGIPGSRNLSSLLIVRVMDFITVIVFALGALWILIQTKSTFADISRFAWMLPLALVVGIVLFVLFVRYFEIVARSTLSWFARMSRFRNRFQWFEKKVIEFTETLKNVWSKKFAIQIVLRSGATWLIAVAMYFWIFRALGVDISLIGTFFLIAFPALMAVLPIQGAANVGTFEAAIVVALLVLGTEKELAITASLAFHIVLWLFAAIVGVIGVILKMGQFPNASTAQNKAIAEK